MNLDLLESFGQNSVRIPEEFDGALDCVSIAVTCAFNRRGTLLAVGCNDGRLVIWDFLTRGIAKVISAHVHPICSISWSRNGQKILSASSDNVVSIWDVVSGECDRTFRFPSPVLKVQFNPRNSDMFLVCPMKYAAVLVNTDGSHRAVPLDDDSDLNIVASFDTKGKYVYIGNARGRILVVDVRTLHVRASFKVTTGTSSTTAIRSMEFARRGKPHSSHFLVNSADRIIRVYDSHEVLTCGVNGEPEPIQKLQDLVNRTMWKKCCFSGDGEYIVAGSSRQHSLYLWEKSVGNLIKILNGTKGELLLDVVWHPVRPIIASISSGLVSIWSQNQVENWSAFAPDFKELDENVEYEERESEFDIEDQDKVVEETKGPLEEDTEVDVTTVEPITAFVSSDEEGEDDEELLYLPVSPEIEETDEAWAMEGQVAATEDHSDRKRTFTNKDHQGTSPKKKKYKSFDVDLPNAPVGEVHPHLNVKKPQEKPARKAAGGRLKNTKAAPKESKSRYRDRSLGKGENGLKENLGSQLS